MTLCETVSASNLALLKIVRIFDPNLHCSYGYTANGDLPSSKYVLIGMKNLPNEHMPLCLLDDLIDFYTKSAKNSAQVLLLSPSYSLVDRINKLKLYNIFSISNDIPSLLEAYPEIKNGEKQIIDYYNN